MSPFFGEPCAKRIFAVVLPSRVHAPPALARICVFLHKGANSPVNSEIQGTWMVKGMELSFRPALTSRHFLSTVRRGVCDRPVRVVDRCAVRRMGCLAYKGCSYEEW